MYSTDAQTRTQLDPRLLPSLVFPWPPRTSTGCVVGQPDYIEHEVGKTQSDIGSTQRQEGQV